MVGRPFGSKRASSGFPLAPSDCLIPGSEFLSSVKVVNQAAFMWPYLRWKCILVCEIPLLVSAWLETLPEIMM